MAVYATVISVEPMKRFGRPEELARFMPSVQKVARAVMVGMNAEGLLLQQFNEPASGQQVFHLHFHLLPCWSGVAIRPP